MSEVYKKRSKENLFKLIGRRSELTPNFALLTGAGASVASGVKMSSDMIGEWRQQLFSQSRSNEQYEKWLHDQIWYNDEEEYSILFERSATNQVSGEFTLRNA
jgi:NAD-dependent SIR2 family protein deacetylase